MGTAQAAGILRKEQKVPCAHWAFLEEQAMQVLLGKEANTLREVFIDSFVDTSCEYYRNRIEHKELFSDGFRCTGYLWDCMRNRERVSEHYVFEYLKEQSNAIYIMWDILSHDRVLIPNYWKYPLESVLSVCAEEVHRFLQPLPEDSYFFEKSLSWAFAITHEELKPGKRLCFLSRIRQMRENL